MLGQKDLAATQGLVVKAVPKAKICDKHISNINYNRQQTLSKISLLARILLLFYEIIIITTLNVLVILIRSFVQCKYFYVTLSHFNCWCMCYLKHIILILTFKSIESTNNMRLRQLIGFMSCLILCRLKISDIRTY